LAWVIPVTAIPIADFTATPPLSGAIPLTVQFNDASTGIGTLAHSWDFGDGGTSNVTNPAHQYTVAGLYTVTLTVTDDDGPTNSSTKTIPDYISIYAEPVAAFTNATPRSGTAPLIVSFTDQSTGSITSHAWDFNNDGTNESILQNPSPYTYTTAGTYTVKLTVTGPGGSDSEIKTDYITVGEVPPVAGFYGTPTSGPKPLGVQFTDASNGVIDTYTWDFGDGHTSNAQNPSHNYPAIGSYTVTLTVTGPGGSDYETKDEYIIVGDIPPIAGFSAAPTSGQKPLNVAFSDASTGNITSYAWNFGDGNTSTLMNPSHQYTVVASYTVTLTVTGPGGPDSETKSNYITVTNTTTKIGTYKEGVGVWNLRITEGTSDLTFTYGAAGDTQLVGDWNGDGKPEAGVYNNGIWYLDYNGNGVYEGPVADRTASFGSAGYKPVVGDWDGTGKDKIGVELNGIWAIDYNGNYVWEGVVIDRYAGFGVTGDNPVVGDWDGTGNDKIGSEKDGFWAIDYNGNYVWDGAVTDRFAGFGQPGDKPVIGDWDGNGRTEIGSFKDGFWAIDYNGN
jgi:PKD repeat protein